MPHQMIYQLLHPWHWLTYGQNATALAAITAILGFLVAFGGLIGLFYYTRYTRVMMQTSSVSLRASFRPVITADVIETADDGTITVKLKNVGNGPATQIFFGTASVDGGAPLNGFLRFESIGAKVIQRGGLSTAMGAGQEETFDIKASLAETGNLLLVNCLDVGGNVCQTAVLSFFDIQGNIVAARHVIAFAVHTAEERAVRELTFRNKTKQQQAWDAFESWLAP